MNLFKYAIAVALLGATGAAAQDAGTFYLGTEFGHETFDDGGTALFGDLDGVVSGVFAGYRYDLGTSAYVAGEVNYTRGGAVDKEYGTGVTIANDSYGVSGVAGYNLTSDVSVYGRLGYQVVELKKDGGPDLDDSGIRYGVGVDFPVPYDFNMRVELSRTDVDNFDSSGSDVEVDRVSAALYMSF